LQFRIPGLDEGTGFPVSVFCEHNVSRASSPRISLRILWADLPIVLRVRLAVESSAPSLVFYCRVHLFWRTPC
jgi:hypothetical protein